MFLFFTKLSIIIKTKFLFNEKKSYTIHGYKINRNIRFFEKIRLNQIIS